VQSRYNKLHAFIIKRRNWGEADKIVTVFSWEKGKVTLLAKGVRKITSRRASSLELFNKVTLLAVATKGMDLITELQLETHHPSFSQDYVKANTAYQLVELVDKLTAENEPHEQLYELLSKALEFIEMTEITKEKMDAVAVRFKVRILELLGFGLPKIQNLEELTAFIEEITEKKLVSRRHFEI
jgi:DNA repair protein RecO (recombination protein O)